MVFCRYLVRVRIATRGAGRASTEPWPLGHQQRQLGRAEQISCGSSSVPAATSSPISRIEWPLGTGRENRACRLPPSVHSTGTTASAPPGIMAPVMIRTHRAGGHGHLADVTGGDLIGDRQGDRCPGGGGGDVGGMHGVPVHRGVVEGGRISGVRGKHATLRRLPRPTGQLNRANTGEHPREVGLHRIHAGHGRSSRYFRSHGRNSAATSRRSSANWTTVRR